MTEETNSRRKSVQLALGIVLMGLGGLGFCGSLISALMAAAVNSTQVMAMIVVNVLLAAAGLLLTLNAIRAR